MNHFALRYMCLLRKYGEAPQSDTTTCFIIDDTVLEKSGVRMDGISRVFDHVKGRCVLGYKLLLCAFFDGKTTMPFDFSLHQEKGKQGDCGLIKQLLKKAYHTKRNTGNPDYKRFQECKMSKIEVAMDMLRRGSKMGLHAKYVITSSCLYRTHSSYFRRNTWNNAPTPYGYNQRKRQRDEQNPYNG